MADEKTTNHPVTDEIATTRNDPDIFAGWMNRLENPDPVLRTESNGKGLKLYNEIARDMHAGSVLQTRCLAVAGKEWEVLPASDSPADMAIADFVKECFDGMNTTQAIAEIMMAVLYGHYETEVMWQTSGGKWTPRRMMAKHPRRFCFDTNRALRMLTPANLVDGEEVPDRKFVVFTYGSSDNPYGDGLGQSLWWGVWFKKCGIKFWLVFLEKFGQPTPIGKYPSGTSPAEQQKLIDALDAFQTSQGIKIPESMKIDLIEATRSGNATYEGMCDYMDRQISKRVLGQTLTTEVKGEGSYAASQTHNEVREDIVKADADVLCEAINASLVRWIVDFNFPPPGVYPRLWLRVEAEQDLTPLATRDKTLVKDIGVPVSKRYFYETYNLPEPDPEDELVNPPTETHPGGAFAEPTGGADPTPIRPMTDAMSDQAAPQWADIIRGVRRIVDDAPDLETLRDRLLSAYAELPETDLADIMAMGFAAADLAGRYDVTQERDDA